MRGITKSPEEAAREAAEAEKSKQTIESARYPHENQSGESKSDETANVMGDAERQAHKSEDRGANENDVPDRTLVAIPAQARSPSTDRDGARMTLPIVEEAGEGSSTGARSARSDSGNGADRPPPTPPKDIQDGDLSPIGMMLQPPQVPPKEGSLNGSLKGRSSMASMRSFDSNKALPMLPKEGRADGARLSPQPTRQAPVPPTTVIGAEQVVTQTQRAEENFVYGQAR